MQEEKKLKPCPLCGEDVILFKEPSNDGTVIWGRLNHGPHIDCGISFIDDLSKVIEKWNKRAVYYFKPIP
jgi:hypothetical protein